jgi:hypothetical protein
MFTLIAGVIDALVGIANRASVITGLGTAAVAGFSLWVVWTVISNFASEDLASLGTGVYLTGLASLFALIAGLQLFNQARKST